MKGLTKTNKPKTQSLHYVVVMEKYNCLCYKMLHNRLLFDTNNSRAKNFQQNIRSYNLMFAFTSPGLKVDTTYNTRRGPPTFHIHGQGHHLIGSLLPMPNNSPKFAQLYIYDTNNEVNDRLSQNP